MDFRKLSDLTVAEFRSLMAEIVAPRPAAAPAVAGGATLPNYGKNKGAPIHGADVATLEYYASGCRRSLADQSKERFHGKERAMLAAIEAEIARQSGGARPAEPPAEYGADGDIHF